MLVVIWGRKSAHLRGEGRRRTAGARRRAKECAGRGARIVRADASCTRGVREVVDGCGEVMVPAGCTCVRVGARARK